MRWLGVLGVLVLAACHTAVHPDGGAWVLRGGTIVGVGPADVEIAGDRIVAVGRVPDGLREVDARGRFLAPAFIDSHVHLAFDPVAPELARGGVAAAVDLAAPERFLGARPHELRVLAAGPMLTSPGGYPLDAWGADGYGLGCTDGKACVDRLVDEGADLIKVALPDLPDGPLAAAVAEAHARGRRVAVHALDAESVRRAAAAGVDLLAHTPVEPIDPEPWRGRAVISTLSAFGGVANLRALRAAGATVLYGTDLGNTQATGMSADEITLLGRAGLDGAAILAAGTSTPAAYWHLDELGAIAPGKRASLLVLETDPLVDPRALARPTLVVVDGRVIK